MQRVITVRRLIGITFLSMILASCSSGGGGGSSSVPNDDSGATNNPSDNGSSGNSSDPLNKLLGKVNFKYNRFDSSSVFNLNPVFSEVKEDSTGSYVSYKFSSTDGIECFYFSKDYFCTRQAKTFYNLYSFRLTSKTVGSGPYEHCSYSISTADCKDKLQSNSDGTVKITVSSSRKSAENRSTIPFNMELITTDADIIEASEDNASSFYIEHPPINFSPELSKKFDSARRRLEMRIK